MVGPLVWGGVAVVAAARRPVRFLAKAPLFRDPKTAWLVKSAGAIPVYRRTDDPAEVGKNVTVAGQTVIFTIPAEAVAGNDRIGPVDGDGNGSVDHYQLTLKFARDQVIAGFTDATGQLRIAQPTDLVSTVIGNDLRVGGDTNTAIAPSGR